MNITEINQKLRQKAPTEIINWALSQAKSPVITTNFRPYESAILHAVARQLPEIKVIWCDTGYNTRETYRHAQELINQLNLNIHLYTPHETSAYRDSLIGIPGVDSPEHKIFSQQVKLEPFKRAMKEHQPDVWFTNLRKGQTAFRNTINVVSTSEDGIIKVSPFYNYTDEDLDRYLNHYGLPNELHYYDPTKVLTNRECGIHH